MWAGQQLPAMILQRIIMQQQQICRREQQQNQSAAAAAGAAEPISNSRPGIPSHGERG